jgi:hypothetical protein
MMKALLFWWDETSWPLAREALRKAGRRDLIGRAPQCLVPPEHGVSTPVGPTGTGPRRTSGSTPSSRYTRSRPIRKR